jgi:hypothetical protein
MEVLFVDARNLVTIHFDPDKFLSQVNDELEGRGLLVARLKGVETRRWHRAAWSHRRLLPPNYPESDLAAWCSVGQLQSVLSTVDRVFVVAQPVRELMGYLHWLSHYAGEFLAKLPNSTEILHARVPHYPWEVILALRAHSLGHRVSWIEPTLLEDRVVMARGVEFHRPNFAVAERDATPRQISISRRLYFSHASNLNEPVSRRFLWKLGVVIWAFMPQLPLPMVKAAALNRKNQAIFSRRFLFGAFVRLVAQNRQSREALRSVAVEVNHEKPYVLVALHYQPEASTDPVGSVFSNQVAFVAELRRLLDRAGLTDVGIVVREHPRQISQRVLGLGELHVRDADFYTQISKTQGVDFARPDDDTDSLILRACAVASVNGSVLWQGLLQGKPAISGRKVWFAECGATASIADLQVENRISKLLSLTDEEVHENLARFLDLEPVTFSGSTSARYVSSNDMAGLASAMAISIEARL